MGDVFLCKTGAAYVDSAEIVKRHSSVVFNHTTKIQLLASAQCKRAPFFYCKLAHGGHRSIIGTLVFDDGIAMKNNFGVPLKRRYIQDKVAM